MKAAHLLSLAFPLLVSASLWDQEILSPPAMSQDPHQDSVFTPVTTSKPSLTDLLTIESSASIYFSYARETEFSKEFSVVDNQLTLLVPTNKAIMALSRKPHQGPETVEPETEMSEQQYDEQSRRNVEHWVAAHVIPSRISLSDVPVTYNTLLDDKSITFMPVAGGRKDSPDWSRVTLQNGIHIIEMKEGENGVIYMIDGTINPQ
ncbi:hypothetical protein OG21DRAFT_1516701 [Imleria badia]|nr:hypothetical protein OG21DRAFT_1517019 [Imleria badia]KAF8548073.1 hypothetical protein OG21DRAFT_1516701 [Imleria badia]